MITYYPKRCYNNHFPSLNLEYWINVPGVIIMLIRFNHLTKEDKIALAKLLKNNTQPFLSKTTYTVHNESVTLQNELSELIKIVGLC